MSCKLSLSCPLNLPMDPTSRGAFLENQQRNHATSNDIYVENGDLVKGDWKNSLLRFFLPWRASVQDMKVSQYFVNCFTRFLAQEKPLQNVERTKSMLFLCEQFVARSKGCFFSSSYDVPRLERYTLIVREKLNLFESQKFRRELMQTCRLDNQALICKWKNLGFPEEAFWRFPDFVDFIFESHLHRSICHADYKHAIQMIPVIPRAGYTTQRNPQTLRCSSEPHLMMNGRMTPWSHLARTISIDEEKRLFSKGKEGKKLYWLYNERGLVQKDRHDFDTLLPFKTLTKAPDSCQVQIVTSHYPKEKWQPYHHLTKGNVHTHFRLIPRKGFSMDHPNSELEDGKVYSIGYGAKWVDVAHYQPLKTIPGCFYNPDSTEFFKEDLMITTIDKLTDEQLLKVVEETKKRAKQLRPFNIVTSNCCTEATEILKRAGVIDLKSEIRGDLFLYKTFVPKLIRKKMRGLSEQLLKFIPAKVANALTDLAFVPFSLLLSPIFLLLGACNIKRPDPDDKRQGELTPMFSKIANIFHLGTYKVSMTARVSKWQKKQPHTIYKKCDTPIG
jgi:hypothetical protein